MKSPYCFIIKPVGLRRYDNIRKFGDTDFYISSSQEDHKTSNRFAEVISVPIYYNGPVQPGDTVVVHHNVFKYYNDMKGRQKSSWNYIMDDLFLAELDQVYLYKRDINWQAVDPFIFIRPIPTEDKLISSTGAHESLWGEVVYKTNTISNVNVGDTVSFTPDSEYEFIIDGETIYRMYNKNICLKREK
jgi:hypothetical protein